MADTITFTGNLAAEPEQRILGGGVSVTNFRVGSTHRRFDKPTERWVDVYTNWYQVSAYRALGENAFASLHKGDRVIVTGRLRLREWDNGTKRGLAVEVEADAVGHDLLRGRTTFHKIGAAAEPGPSGPAVGAVAEQPEPAPAAAGVSPVAATDAGGWGIPAATVDRAPEAELADTPF
ncbi:single-strand DNA-binding protein [Microbacterium sp. AG1240]|uniref:single-stranded DNA-binding protein n=1 Tax=Microbacterium sp. AG1240 TaxID=2183992 RepID=UPI000EACA84F|nr:single-stranded DNA-binding protein [Microbacterium sp. AG1240]RKT36759.1 single-strand DNA-binding protein [Microbacterium sp. AG1240]